MRPQAASKSYLEHLSMPPAVALQPLASGLQVASAGSAKRKQFKNQAFNLLLLPLLYLSSPRAHALRHFQCHQGRSLSTFWEPFLEPCFLPLGPLLEAFQPEKNALEDEFKHGFKSSWGGRMLPEGRPKGSKVALERRRELEMAKS